MRNQSAYMRLSRTVKIMQRIKENGRRSEQVLKIQVTKRISHHLRISMHLIEDRDFSLRSKTRMMVGRPRSVGVVEEIIVGQIVHRIKVVDYISKLLRGHRHQSMLNRVSLKFMQCEVIEKQTTRHLLSRWMVRYLIKLFIFLLTLDLIIVILILTSWISVV